MRPLAVLLFLVVTNACATLGEKHYDTPQAQLSGSTGELLAAAEHNASQKGWAILRHDDRAGVVEAVAPSVVEDGVETREHWYFRAGRGTLSAQRIFEVRWSASDKTWHTSEMVCEGYQYTREHEELAAISRALGQHLALREELPQQDGSTLSTFD